jgi:chromosomal replication initiator protein
MGTELNPYYTFENFIPGSNNRLALAACIAIADKGYIREYNPLFLYSGSGLGKTHLLHALRQHILKEHPKKRVKYVSSETFTNELVTAILEKQIDEFRNQYRKVDILLFDDVQFISGKTATQEELFHTFNELYDAGKQIIFTSDQPPWELVDIPERLVSRLGQGLTVDIQPPDYETRVAVLMNLSSLYSLELTREVKEALDMIAQNVTTNVRDLNGAFTRVIAPSRLLDLPQGGLTT